jgi:hypothetical protein
MSRLSILLKLTKVDGSGIEGVEVKAAGNKWKSPPVGGWLKVQNGVWNQLPDGLHLMDAANEKQIGICRGCFFFTSKNQDSGSSIYPESGSAGNWIVIDTTDT